MASIKEQLFSEVAEGDAHSNNKVTVVGIGQVGMACAFSILTQVCESIFLYICFFFSIIEFFSVNYTFGLRYK